MEDVDFVEEERNSENQSHELKEQQTKEDEASCDQRRLRG